MKDYDFSSREIDEAVKKYLPDVEIHYPRAFTDNTYRSAVFIASAVFWRMDPHRYVSRSAVFYLIASAGVIPEGSTGKTKFNTVTRDLGQLEWFDRIGEVGENKYRPKKSVYRPGSTGKRGRSVESGASERPKKRTMMGRAATDGRCGNCGCQDTPTWRLAKPGMGLAPGLKVCNACGLYWANNGKFM